MQTLQQRMATKAYQQVSNLPADYVQKYGTMAHKLPILIHTAGLAQALAFVQARDEPTQHKLLDHIADAIEFDGIQTGSQLAERSRTAQLEEYMLLTRRVLAALLWYKRFVESLYKIQPRDEATAASVPADPV